MPGVDDWQELRGRVQPVPARQLHEQRHLPQAPHTGVRVQLYARLHGRVVRPAQAAVVPGRAVCVWAVHIEPERAVLVRLRHTGIRGPVL